jgi:hypothetical protein
VLSAILFAVPFGIHLNHNIARGSWPDLHRVHPPSKSDLFLATTDRTSLRMRDDMPPAKISPLSIRTLAIRSLVSLERGYI